MFNKLVKFVVDLLVKRCIKKGKIFKIVGGKNDDVYLVRYIVYKGKLGCIYVHRFMRSDADSPHDHPFNFWTYIISGGYHEVFYDRSKPIIDPYTKKFESFWTRSINIREPGDFAYRRANDIHQVVVDKTRTIDEIKDAPYTICFIGPRVREWGFWPLEMKGSGFLDWREYLNITPNDSRIEGSE